MTAALPIIDFSRWLAGSPEEKRQVAHDLAQACRDVGFVYVTHHGVPQGLVDEAFGWARKLFALPLDQKMLAPHPPGPEVHRGYSWPGLEKVSQYVHQEGEDPDAEDEALRRVQDCKESFEVGSEALAAQPNQWLPEPVLPGFRAFATGFYWACNATARELLRAVAVGLGLGLDADGDALARFHSGHNNQLRLLHYPPVETARLSSNALARMPAHSDWGSITLLFQDDCGGLQVEDAKTPGRFVDATPVPGALVMNVGDLLMRWSNDSLKSTLHRVTVPPLAAPDDQQQPPASGGGGNKAPLMTRARYSIPYFVSPDPDAVIECLSACLDARNPVAKYPPVVQEEYRRMRAKLQYTEKPSQPALATPAGISVA